MVDPIISLKEVNFSYEKKQILHDINLDIPKGSFLGLIGPNGGGKTTLIKLILGLIKPNSGEILLFGKPLTSFKDKSKIGFVSQKSNSFNKGFPATVYEVVSMGLTAKLGYFSFPTKKDREKVVEAIEQVGMTEYMHQNIGNLSGGQQQRVFIARSLVSDPELLILDEPTVGVDNENVQRFYDLLYKINKERHITLLLITHDTGTITSFVTDIACLNQTLHFHGKPDEYEALDQHDLSKIYGHAVHIVTHDHS
ncbi:metal ABC transporter ATP-binding protein [Virgibacillus soli]|uniref:metal ABC transporter ATP-binding protein n=1 Tax=Paracerasibacillus soli TaxID=480284 RepID=UPI0035E5DE89